jgi:hypothetical protein
MPRILLVVVFLIGNRAFSGEGESRKKLDDAVEKELMLKVSQNKVRLALAKLEHELALASRELASLQYDNLFEGLRRKPGVSPDDIRLAFFTKRKHQWMVKIKSLELDLADFELSIAELQLRIHRGK